MLRLTAPNGCLGLLLALSGTLGCSDGDDSSAFDSMATVGADGSAGTDEGDSGSGSGDASQGDGDSSSADGGDGDGDDDGSAGDGDGDGSSGDGSNGDGDGDGSNGTVGSPFDTSIRGGGTTATSGQFGGASIFGESAEGRWTLGTNAETEMGGDPMQTPTRPASYGMPTGQ